MAKNEAQDVETVDEGDAPLIDMNDASIKKMMARAEKRGTITIDEINAAIPADQNEMIEDIMSRLSERGVTVVENDEESGDEDDKEPEANLEDAGVSRSCSERQQRRSGRDLEETGLDPRARIDHLRQGSRQLVIPDQPPGDADALVEAHQMRTGEGMNAVSARLERGAQEGHGRALAVRPGNVEDGRKRFLRPTEPVEQCRDAFKPEPVAGRRKLRQPVELRLNLGIRGAGEIRHQAASFASGAR